MLMFYFYLYKLFAAHSTNCFLYVYRMITVFARHNMGTKLYLVDVNDINFEIPEEKIVEEEERKQEEKFLQGEVPIARERRPRYCPWQLSQ